MYETDSRGNCVKNGPHCAFAHGASDLRPPVFDKSEVQGIELLEKTHDTSMLSITPTSTSSSAIMEKEKMPAEDPKWNGNEESCHVDNACSLHTHVIVMFRVACVSLFLSTSTT